MSIAAKIQRKAQQYGETLALVRETTTAGGGVPTRVTVNCAGFVTDYDEENLVQNFEIGDLIVIITNVEIAAAAWPGPPRPNDYLVVGGRRRRIKGVWERKLGNQPLVFKVWCAG